MAKAGSTTCAWYTEPRRGSLLLSSRTAGRRWRSSRVPQRAQEIRLPRKTTNCPSPSCREAKDSDLRMWMPRRWHVSWPSWTTNSFKGFVRQSLIIWHGPARPKRSMRLISFAWFADSMRYFSFFKLFFCHLCLFGNILDIFQHQVSIWVQHCIVSCDSLKKRAACVEKFVKIGQVLVSITLPFLRTNDDAFISDIF